MENLQDYFAWWGFLTALSFSVLGKLENQFVGHSVKTTETEGCRCITYPQYYAWDRYWAALNHKPSVSTAVAWSLDEVHLLCFAAGFAASPQIDNWWRRNCTKSWRALRCLRYVSASLTALGSWTNAVVLTTNWVSSAANTREKSGGRKGWSSIQLCADNSCEWFLSLLVRWATWWRAEEVICPLCHLSLTLQLFQGLQ